MQGRKRRKDRERRGYCSIDVFAAWGACGLAPVTMIGDDAHPQATSDRMPSILEKYLERSRKPSAA